MLNSSTELPQKALQIKEDDKFFSRLLTKESSMANPSSRVYYGGSTGAVPFLWESQPGTPKHTFNGTSLPPLTLPPSYHFVSKQKPAKRSSKSNLFHTILPRLSLKKTHVPSSPSPSSLSWTPSLSSSSCSTTRTPCSNHHIHSRISSSSLSSFDSGIDDEYQGLGSPTSTLCFGGGRESTATGLSGSNSMLMVKNAFLSIVCHGSARGTSNT